MLFYDSLDILAEFLELLSLAIKIRNVNVANLSTQVIILHLSMYFLCARLEFIYSLSHNDNYSTIYLCK